MEQPPSRYRLVLCTCPDRNVGERLGEVLVTSRLAACVNLLDGVTSIYEWEGNIVKDGEVLLLIKSRSDCLDALKAEIVTHHPYELPEIVAVAVDGGLPAYLRWIDECLKPPQ